MKQISVVLIDDDRTSRKGLSRYLRTQAKFKVADYDNGIDALNDLKTNWQSYTAILLDFVLKPSMTGEEVLTEIRAKDL